MASLMRCNWYGRGAENRVVNEQVVAEGEVNRFCPAQLRVQFYRIQTPHEGFGRAIPTNRICERYSTSRNTMMPE